MLSVLLQTMNDIIEVAPQIDNDCCDEGFDIQSNLGSDSKYEIKGDHFEQIDRFDIDT